MPGLCVLVAASLLFLSSFDVPGFGMDEGGLVAYPSLIMEGKVPGRDLATFYGPGSPYLIAAGFELFGPSLAVERAIGIAFRVAIVMAIFALLVPIRAAFAVLGALAAAVLLLPIGVYAAAVFGALAALLGALALLARRRSFEGREVIPDAVAVPAAGVAAGVALTFRPDFAPAVLLGVAPLLIGTADVGRGRDRAPVRFLIGLLIGCIPLVIWVLIVGLPGISRLIEDLAASRPARQLPLPGLDSAQGQLLAVAALSALLALVGGVVRVIRAPGDWLGRVMLAVGLTLTCLLPATLQRADSHHVLTFAAVSVGLFPLVAAGILDLARAGRRAGLWVGAVLVAVACVAGAFANQAVPSLKAHAEWVDGPGSPVVSIGERSFRIGEPQAGSFEKLLPRLAARTDPGDRLFVGTEDLSRPVYADTFVYYLFPELEPASFYTELNPGAANAEDSGLADDLRSADALLLTTFYDFLAQQNEAAGRPGSTAADEVVDESFCVAARHGTYRLYLRCRR